MTNITRENLKLYAVIVGIVAGVFLLGPYLGLRLIGSTPPQPAVRPLMEREPAMPLRAGAKQPVTGDHKNTPETHSMRTPGRKLSDIEELLW